MYNYVSLFSGAGGLDIGLERSGFHAISMNEIDPVFCQTLRSNSGYAKSDGIVYFDNTQIINEDIRKVTSTNLSRGQRIDCVIGGPPCQSFSSAGNQLSILDDRGRLVNEYVRIIGEIQPSVFLFENVRGIVTSRDEFGRPGGVIEKIFHELQSIGYSCRASLLNSADYGSYQRRVRCFIIGVRSGTAPNFPVPSHKEGSGSLFCSPHRSLGQFMEQYSDTDESNYVYPTSALLKILECLPDGSGVKSVGASEPTRPGGHWGYRQGTFIADKTKPARTVTGSSSQDWIRWNGHLRRLTLLEIKRLQGFPDDWHFVGNTAQVYRQIGNAVPIVFGELLGRVMQDHLSRKDNEPPVKLELPLEFQKYIKYTINDQQRNRVARKIHKQFE
jgi:DNA (cytosine-5)-methyltransferase 1